MRFYFHISSGPVRAEDEEGMELPTFLAALEEGSKIARDLLNDPDAIDLRDGVVQVVGSAGLVFMTLPISPTAANRLN
jgi:hypothetical protein